MTIERQATTRPRIAPYLYYEDVSAAMDWLAKAFGLVETERQADASGVVGHAAMRLGEAVVMMGYPGPEYRSPRHGNQRTSTLYVYVDDVDAHYKRAKQAGATIIAEPADQEYGDRRYGAEDPEGQQWYFAQPIGNEAARFGWR